MDRLEHSMAEMRQALSELAEISHNVEILTQCSATRSSNSETITTVMMFSLVSISWRNSDSTKNLHPSSEPSDTLELLVMSPKLPLLIEPEMDCISLSAIDEEVDTHDCTILVPSESGSALDSSKESDPFSTREAELPTVENSAVHSITMTQILEAVTMGCMISVSVSGILSLMEEALLDDFLNLVPSAIKPNSTDESPPPYSLSFFHPQGPKGLVAFISPGYLWALSSQILSEDGGLGQISSKSNYYLP